MTGKAHVYRPDVDGLRALAVLAVLAYHAFPQSAPGGFAGVDVFFVISGFLITGIILDGLKDGSFTVADFYWRRVRRIFPALILVLAFSLGLGWLVLLPDEFVMLGKHVAAGAGFVSNIVFWREAGYFDAAAELKPLLHLWSLGVEEQYYLVWPLLLFLFRKDAKRMLGMMLALAVLSFAANLWLTGVRPSAAFYLPLSRFWELMVGGLLAVSCRQETRYGNAAAVAGFGLLALTFGLLHTERDFPGWWAALPVAGTALLIAAGPAAWINRHVLANRAMVYVGLISYPLYLWHWPLLSYARIVEGGEPPAALRWGLLAAAVVLSVLTYELVEKKIRFARLPALRRLSFPALAASMAVAGVAGLLALQTHVQPRSASVPLVLEISSASADWSYGGDRVIPGDTKKAVLFFGDSHMQHYWPRIDKLVRERGAPLRTVIFKTTGGCAPVPGIERRSQQCGRFVEEGLRLAHRPEVETVVIAASWVGFVNRPDYYKAGDPEQKPLRMLAPESAWVLKGLEAELKRLTAAGKQVVLVLSSPRGDAFDPKSVIEREGMTVQVREPLGRVPRAELAQLTSPIDSRLVAIAGAAGAAVIDPAEYLCSKAFCPAADERGRPLYKDGSHLRASYVRERFSAVDRFVFVEEKQPMVRSERDGPVRLEPAGARLSP
jgi:peptidoglycan/LPS O-acetylase OafA/YrhL